MRSALLLAALLASAFSPSARAQATEGFAPRPGVWFPPFTPPSPLTTDAERREAEVFDAFINRLVETDCPANYAFSGTDAWGRAFVAGEEVNARIQEACIDRQIVLMTPVVSESLDNLYALLRRIEGGTSSGLADGLVATQATWLAHRDALCNYQVAWFFGGTGASLTWLSCSVDALRAHRAWVDDQIARAHETVPVMEEGDD